MRYIQQSIPDVWVLEPTLHQDERGYFMENFRQDEFNATVGYPVTFVQDNRAHSLGGVWRGLHYQKPPYAQGKLVQVIEGAVLDIAVDLRRGSPTYAHYVAIELSAQNRKQLFIPRGFAHGYLVLSASATCCYKVDQYYAPLHEQGLRFDDPAINITWPHLDKDWILSDKDRHLPYLDTQTDVFDFSVDYYAI